MSIAPPHPSLLKLLDDEVAQLRGFVALLESEQQALAAGDVDSLTRLAAEKSAIFERLAGLGEARSRALAANIATNGGEGIEAWLRSSANDAARRAWQELLALASKARAMNQTNGALIATRLANNQQALAALLAAANQPGLYCRDGHSRPLGGGRSLGKV